MALHDIGAYALAIGYLLIRQAMSHRIHGEPFGRRQQIVVRRSSTSFYLASIVADRMANYLPLFCLLYWRGYQLTRENDGNR
jgi:hypothetical protein